MAVDLVLALAEQGRMNGPFGFKRFCNRHGVIAGMLLLKVIQKQLRDQDILDCPSRILWESFLYAVEEDFNFSGRKRPEPNRQQFILVKF